MISIRWLAALPLLAGLPFGFNSGISHAAAAHTSLVTTTSGSAYDIGVSGIYCSTGTVCDSEFGDYIYGSADAYGYPNGGAVGQLQSGDITCVHAFTVGNVYHYQRGRVYGQVGTASPETVRGAAGAIGYLGEGSGVAKGVLLFTVTDSHGNSGTATGVFTANHYNNNSDALVTANVTLSIHGQFTDEQHNMATNTFSRTTITSLQCNLNSSNPTFHPQYGEAELESN